MQQQCHEVNTASFANTEVLMALFLRKSLLVTGFKPDTFENAGSCDDPQTQSLGPVLQSDFIQRPQITSPYWFVGQAPRRL